MSIVRKVYGVAGLVGPFLMLPSFLLSERGRTRVRERFGSWKVPPGEYTWFHGASMGEMRGLIPLIAKFRETYPDRRVLVSATSVTGVNAAANLADATAILPFDHQYWIRRALRGISIRKLLIAETEVWPCLLEEMAARNVDVCFVNGRISKHSFPRYLSFAGSLVRAPLSAVSNILCSDNVSADRYRILGAVKTSVVGNTKYDAKPSVQSREEAAGLKKLFFREDIPVFTIGSIRPGEEKVLFPALALLLARNIPLNVVVAPRHKEKFSYFEGRLKEHGIAFRKWSEREKWSSEDWKVNVVLLDGLGMLEKVYSFSNLAFIGATLVDIGGHNPMEAAAYGVPIVTGPYISNIEEVAESLLVEGGMIEVHTSHDLEGLLAHLAEKPGEFFEKGRNALKVWAGHQGTVDRAFRILFESAESS